MPPAKKPVKMLKVTISTRVDPVLKKHLERLAKAEKRTISQYVEIVLEQHSNSRG